MGHRKPSSRAIAAAVAAWLAIAVPAEAQLAVDGETVADAKTFEAAKKEGRLLAYGTYPGDMMKPILAAFESDTGIKAEYVRLPSQGMYQRVTAEFAAKKLEADYIDLTDLPLIQQLINRGILNVPHRVPAFEQIPAAIKDPQGRWYAVIRPVAVIAVNRSRVADADIPKSWKDLINPKWKGIVGTVSIDAGGSVLSLYSFLREKVDPDFWPKFAALTPRIYPTIAPLTTDIARGEIALGIGAIAEPIWLQMKAGAPVKVVFPSEGIAVFPAAGGISTTAKNPNAAALFLNWLTSKRGGNVIARGGAYPANPGSNRPHLEGLEYPSVDRVWNLQLAEWMAERESRMKLWRETFGVK
ncbi:MAG TPA: extracellular solute-binding protein [Xanthobacteraceae bacterium]